VLVRTDVLLPVRLSLRPVGGQGQPYGDDVVALARELVEDTVLTQKEIGARIGVSHMTISRWARAGKWRRPYGAARPFDETGWSLAAMQRFSIRTKPWRLLEEAEALLAKLAGQGRADLADIERALELLLAAVGPQPSRDACVSLHRVRRERVETIVLHRGLRS
jgi:transposase